MFRLRYLLVSCLLIVPSVVIAQTNPVYLSKLPSPQRIETELKGSDAMDTAARQMGAFWRLRQLVRDLAYGAQRRPDSQLTPDEKAFINAYDAAYVRAMRPFLAVQNSPTHPDKPRWRKLTLFYSMDAAFFDEVLRHFCAPDFREIYYRITGSPRPTDSEAPSNSGDDAEQSSSDIQTPEILFKQTYVCNGERVIVSDCVNNRSDSARCIVNYPDRPREIADVSITAFENRGVLRQRLATCKQPNTASSKPPVNATPSAGDARKPPLNARTVHLQEPYVCNGERVIVTDCEVNDKSVITSCTVNYPDRPRPRNIVKGQPPDAMFKLFSTCKPPPNVPSVNAGANTAERKMTGEKTYKNTTEQVMQMSDEQTDAYDRLLKQGNAYLDSKQYEEAAVTFKKAIAIAPHITFAHNRLGYTYLSLERFPEAVTELKEAIRLEPDDPEAYLNLGLTYGRLKDNLNASKMFEQLVRVRPDAQGYSLLGSSYKRLEQYDKAVAALKQAVRLKPDDSFSWASLGFSYYYLNRDAEALSALQEAIRVDPKNAYAYRGIGYLYVDQGRKDDAMRIYRKLLTLDKSEADRLDESIKEMKTTP